MDQNKRLCGYYNYTVVLTYLGMLIGFTGIMFAMEGAYRQAIICLMTSGVCDMFDGTVASTKQRDMREKKFGIQIDSLSDLICFGALPALFTYHIGGKHYITFLASCFYLLCTLIRLAYFNVLEEERQETETGKRKWYAVLHTLEAMEREGTRKITRINPEPDGILDPEKVAAEADGTTNLVSVMAANNEIGALQPIAEISRAIKKSSRSLMVFHTDAVQAVGHVPVDVQKMGVDMLSLSAHKFGGPRGVGALYCRSGVTLDPFLFGGGQERGRRPGTENTAAIVAMAVAMREACENMTTAAEYTRRLRDKLVDRILEIPGANINGSMNNRLPGNINCRFDGVEGEAVVIMLDLAGVCVSAGSACTSGSGEPSHVLTAMGQTRRDAYGAIRITLAETNTEAEVEYIADQLAAIVKDLRRK